MKDSINMKLHLTQNRIWSYKLYMPVRRSKISSWILFLEMLISQDGENHVSVKINVPHPWDGVRGLPRELQKLLTDEPLPDILGLTS